MDKYHKRDIKLVEDNLPALTKVKHIDELIEKLSKVRFEDFKGIQNCGRLKTQWRSLISIFGKFFKIYYFVQQGIQREFIE